MDLPTADGSPTPQQRTLAISINAQGELFLDAEPRTEDALRADVQAYARDTAEPDRRAAIAADASVSHGQVVHIIDLLRRNGVNHFAINVRPQDLQ
jgi:biopolymer transport protein ExbD